MVRRAVIWVCQILLAPSIFAGEYLTLAEKVFEADFILEVRLNFTKPIPRNWKNKEYDPSGWGFPDVLIRKAKSSATLMRILKDGWESSEPLLPEDYFVFSVNSPCWWSAHRAGSMKTLIFLIRDAAGNTSNLVGVEHEGGMYSDLNPEYDQLVKAIVEAVSWPEERTRAVTPGMLWQKQKEFLLSSGNRYLLHLAARFLEKHSSEEAVDEIWGLHGSVRRSDAEARAQLPEQLHCLP